MMVPQSVVVCLAFLAFVSATDVDLCDNFTGRSLDSLRSDVELSPCPKIPCVLKKGTRQEISVRFKPDNPLTIVENSVQANVGGLDVPFIGVDNQSICDKVYTETGEKTSCPLEAGTTYLYKDSFPIFSFYPRLNTKVTWALKSAGKTIVCFQVPAKIK